MRLFWDWSLIVQPHDQSGPDAQPVVRSSYDYVWAVHDLRSQQQAFEHVPKPVCDRFWSRDLMTTATATSCTMCLRHCDPLRFCCSIGSTYYIGRNLVARPVWPATQSTFPLAYVIFHVYKGLMLYVTYVYVRWVWKPGISLYRPWSYNYYTDSSRL